ncbi:hypothetical protein PROFUN_08290 [Planoprotostelium fungivorum]|uniref:Uncharacterized protein n=1 Tax=Planoprotostelium fungivorum TaxID=1890364 RepID=A0A2P6NJZ1_9EUKA|nr:hypothetical protein PROFUN_08290 [Planoprotostelium fungivorum]
MQPNLPLPAWSPTEIQPKAFSAYETEFLTREKRRSGTSCSLERIRHETLSRLLAYPPEKRTVLRSRDTPPNSHTPQRWSSNPQDTYSQFAPLDDDKPLQSSSQFMPHTSRSEEALTSSSRKVTPPHNGAGASRKNPRGQSQKEHSRYDLREDHSGSLDGSPLKTESAFLMREKQNPPMKRQPDFGDSVASIATSFTKFKKTVISRDVPMRMAQSVDENLKSLENSVLNVVSKLLKSISNKDMMIKTYEEDRKTSEDVEFALSQQLRITEAKMIDLLSDDSELQQLREENEQKEEELVSLSDIVEDLRQTIEDHQLSIEYYKQREQAVGAAKRRSISAASDARKKTTPSSNLADTRGSPTSERKINRTPEAKSVKKSASPTATRRLSTPDSPQSPDTTRGNVQIENKRTLETKKKPEVPRRPPPPARIEEKKIDVKKKLPDELFAILDEKKLTRVTQKSGPTHFKIEESSSEEEDVIPSPHNDSLAEELKRGEVESEMKAIEEEESEDEAALMALGSSQVESGLEESDAASPDTSAGNSRVSTPRAEVAISLEDLLGMEAESEEVIEHTSQSIEEEASTQISLSDLLSANLDDQQPSQEISLSDLISANDEEEQVATQVSLSDLNDEEGEETLLDHESTKIYIGDNTPTTETSDVPQTVVEGRSTEETSGPPPPPPPPPIDLELSPKVTELKVVIVKPPTDEPTKSKAKSAVSLFHALGNSGESLEEQLNKRKTQLTTAPPAQPKEAISPREGLSALVHAIRKIRPDSDKRLGAIAGMDKKRTEEREAKKSVAGQALSEGRGQLKTRSGGFAALEAQREEKERQHRQEILEMFEQANAKAPVLIDEADFFEEPEEDLTLPEEFAKGEEDSLSSLLISSFLGLKSV